MKAVVVEQFGGPEVLTLQEIDTPKPGPGQAPVRITLAGVNFVDIYQRRGTYPRKLLFIPGLEGSGVVRRRQ